MINIVTEKEKIMLKSMLTLAEIHWDEFMEINGDEISEEDFQKLLDEFNRDCS
jgi:hypothetical protein